jgi:hypothetical protein
LASLARRVAPAVSATSLAAISVSVPQPLNSSSSGARRETRVLISPSSSLALRARRRLHHQLAGDPHASALLGAGQLAGEAIEPAGPIEAARRQLQLGPEVAQVPAQPLLVCRAGLDDVLTMVEQELQLQRGLIEVCGRQGLGLLAQSGPGDREGVVLDGFRG